ncbi:hypothetical protein ANN_24563 [Periplaneta americana]|uniref:Uncharacterized protein n=1 Tax=Periplaneta americana TaxID=6978 RepID=A0ABQ8S3R2_PERAM|nr:hypothetical protein ANN_24563 [Periplaneta americana]
MDLRQVGYEARDWINLALDRRRAYVRTAMNLRVLRKPFSELVKTTTITVANTGASIVPTTAPSLLASKETRKKTSTGLKSSARAFFKLERLKISICSWPNCFPELFLRIDRHNTVRSIIANRLREHGEYEVYEEVQCLSTEGSTRRADIIIIDREKKTGLILDHTVRFEINEDQPKQIETNGYEETTSVANTLVIEEEEQDNEEEEEEEVI